MGGIDLSTNFLEEKEDFPQHHIIIIYSVSWYADWIRMYTGVLHSLVCCLFSKMKGGFDTHTH